MLWIALDALWALLAEGKSPQWAPMELCLFPFPRTHLDRDLNKFTRRLANPHHQGIYVLFHGYDLPCRTQHISPLVIAFHHVALFGIQHRARVLYLSKSGFSQKEPSHTVGGNVNWCSHYGDSMEILQKTKNRATTWSSNHIPGHISREKHNLKRYMHLNFSQ